MKSKKFHLTPTLAVILVGNDPASEVYVSNKEKSAHAVGMNSIQFKMSGDISEAELITKIEELNNDKKFMAYWFNCHFLSILMQKK